MRSDRPVVLITGATSGLGREAALGFARLGWRVLVHGRAAARCADVVRAIESEGAGTACGYVARLDDFDELIALVAAIHMGEARLDWLVNNAGTGFDAMPGLTTEGLSPEAQVNYLAPLFLAHALAPLLKGADWNGGDRGGILNIASAGQYPISIDWPHAPSSNRGVEYGRSKLALIMASRALAEETGLGVWAVNPGSLLPTPLAARLLDRMPRPVRYYLAWRYRSEGALQKAAALIMGLVAQGRGEGVADLLMRDDLLIQANGAGRVHGQRRDDAIWAGLWQRANALLAPHLARIDALMANNGSMACPLRR